MLKVIKLSAISVQAAKPTTRYGALAYMNISTAARMLARPSLAGIPRNAVVSSASFAVRNRGVWSGTRTMTVAQNTSAWSTRQTWNTRPTVTGGIPLTKASAAGGTFWLYDLTTLVQGWVSGTIAQHGVSVYSSSSTPGVFWGSTSAYGPTLTIEYLVPAEPPTELNPSDGAVSVDKPTLTFNVDEDTLAVQVQLDPTGNEVAPAFDSGELAATAGLVDLAATAYPGLADGATTQWRARAKNGLGWSAWSDWVEFNRITKSALTISQPGATSEDPSPVVVWSFAGVQMAWRVLVYGELGKLISDTGWTPGDATEAATTKSVGASGRVVVQVQDDKDRASTPGDPDYTEAEQAFVVSPSGAPAPMDTLTATQDGVSPIVAVTGSRAAIPDEVAIYRNGELLARKPGIEVFTDTAFVYEDSTAPMNNQATYQVRPIVNGQWAAPGPEAVITPTCVGIWLINVQDDTRAVLWGNDAVEQSQPEAAVVHTPITSADGEVEVVRRRLVRYPRQGSLSGTVVETPYAPASMSETNLRAWAEEDAGTLYRLILGDLNDVVILGDLTFAEQPENGPGNGRVLSVSANWWARRGGA